MAEGMDWKGGIYVGVWYTLCLPAIWSCMYERMEDLRQNELFNPSRIRHALNPTHDDLHPKLASWLGGRELDHYNTKRSRVSRPRCCFIDLRVDPSTTFYWSGASARFHCPDPLLQGRSSTFQGFVPSFLHQAISVLSTDLSAMT